MFFIVLPAEMKRRNGFIPTFGPYDQNSTFISMLFVNARSTVGIGLHLICIHPRTCNSQITSGPPITITTVTIPTTTIINIAKQKRVPLPTPYRANEGKKVPNGRTQFCSNSTLISRMCAVTKSEGL